MVNEMQFNIGDRSYELVDENAQLPQGQRELVSALKEKQSWSTREIVAHLHLRSPAPLWSRVEHLIRKGIVKPLTAVNA
jgi:hypothetical protein